MALELGNKYFGTTLSHIFIIWWWISNLGQEIRSSNNIFDYFHPMPLCCYKWMNYFDYNDLSKILSYHKTFSFFFWIGLIFSLTRCLMEFFELDLFSHSLAASWSFLTKKIWSFVFFWSRTSAFHTNTTQLGSDCHITGNQIIFSDEKCRIFHWLFSLLSFEFSVICLTLRFMKLVTP